MARPVLIIGESKSGKTTSIGANKELEIEGLNPKETFIIQIIAKDLPFSGSAKQYTKFSKEAPKGNLIATRDPQKVLKIVAYINEKRPEIKNIVIDDLQYIMGLDYMENAQKRGFDIFKDIALNLYTVMQTTVIDSSKLRDDIFIFFMIHGEFNNKPGDRIVKAKTVGNMFDQHVTLEGLFNIVLYSTRMKVGENLKHVFQTAAGGEFERIGAPHGMFKELYIVNDLAQVRQSMIEYYGIT